MKKGVELIAEERKRQVEVEGWTMEHDKSHNCGELSDMAVCYALRPYWRSRLPLNLIFPFDEVYWKPSSNDRVRDLVKAGALIAAEIDRLNNLNLID